MRKLLLYIIILTSMVTTSYGCRSAHSNKSDISQTPVEMKATQVVVPNSKLVNIFRVDEGIYRSEQPSAKDFKALKEYGINSVLNLRNWHSDDRGSRNSGMKLYHLKARAKKLTEAILLEAMKMLIESPKGVLIHCWHGSDRTGAVVATYRIVIQDWTKEQAIEEMLNGGFGFYAKFADEVVPVIEGLDIPSMRNKLGVVIEKPEITPQSEAIVERQQ